MSAEEQARIEEAQRWMGRLPRDQFDLLLLLVNRGIEQGRREAIIERDRLWIEELPDYIDLFRIIRAAGRRDRDKARAVRDVLDKLRGEAK